MDRQFLSTKLHIGCKSLQEQVLCFVIGLGKFQGVKDDRDFH
jgi:hypothetical protein